MINNFLINVNLPHLEPHLRDGCEGALSFEEADAAIKLMQNGKTPGLDGLSVELFLFVWP